MKKTIRIVQLEEKYLLSAMECLLSSQLQSETIQSDLNLNREQLETDLFNQLNDRNNQKRAIVAVDINDAVIGIIIALDIQDFFSYINSQSQQTIYKEINRHSFEPLKELIAKRGKTLVVTSVAIRKEYENMKISQILLDRHIQLAEKLGYTLITGLVYNPKVATILIQLNAKNYYTYTFEEIRDAFPQISKTNFKNDVYIYGIQIQPQTVQQNVLQEYPQAVPRL